MIFHTACITALFNQTRDQKVLSTFAQSSTKFSTHSSYSKIQTLPLSSHRRQSTSVKYRQTIKEHELFKKVATQKLHTPPVCVCRKWCRRKKRSKIKGMTSLKHKYMYGTEPPAFMARLLGIKIMMEEIILKPR